MALQQASNLQKRQQSLTSTRAKLDDRIAKLGSGRRKAVDKHFQRVLVNVGAHLRKPQRKTRLSPSEDALRILLNWQSSDRAQRVAVRGTNEELLQQVRSPAE